MSSHVWVYDLTAIKFASPNLTGDSNLNMECIRLALVQYSKDFPGLPPNLYVQFDSASDNKSRFTMGSLAWLVENNYFHQVESVMLPVGHTHEDIDQAFRVISEALDRVGFVETLEKYMNVIRHAWAGETQHVELLPVVHDFISWQKGYVWETDFKAKEDVNTLKFITTARYFKIRRRETDGVVCLWYLRAP